jgi:hypothetical protein
LLGHHCSIRPEDMCLETCKHDGWMHYSNHGSMWRSLLTKSSWPANKQASSHESCVSSSSPSIDTNPKVGSSPTAVAAAAERQMQTTLPRKRLR